MKKSLLLTTFLFLGFSNSLFAESDIIWTKSIGSMVRTVKFSPDGRYVYAAAQGRGPLKLDANTGEILMEYKGFKFEREKYIKYCMQLSSSGDFLYVGDNGNQIYKYDTKTDKLSDSIDIGISQNQNPFIWTIGLSNNYLFACYAYTISPNGVEEIRGRFKIYNLETKKEVKEVKELNIDDATNIEVFEDKQLVAVSTTKDDNTGKAYIYLFNINNFEIIHTFDEHTDSITDLSFSPDGTLLASCATSPYIVNIWDLEKNELVMSFKPNGAYTYCIEMLSNNLLASSNGNWEKIFLKSNKLDNKEEVYSTNSFANEFEFYKNEKVVLSGSSRVQLLNADRLSSIPFHIGKEKLYPNPANQNLTIPKSYFDENFLYFNITDMTGKEVYKYNKTPYLNFNEDMLVDVSNYLAGSYIIQLFYTTSIQTLKFIKE